MNNDIIKKNISDNLIRLRLSAGYTQSEIAEKINYSDKSVSKWERAEGTPDVFVLAQLAKIYGVNVGDFFKGADEAPEIIKPKLKISQRAIINLLSVGLVWLVAVTLHFLLSVILSFMQTEFNYAWMIYVYAIPVSGIVMTVFSKLWWNSWVTFASNSVIIWGVALCVFLTFKFFGVGISNVYTIFIVSAVLEVLALLMLFLNRLKQKSEQKTDV